MLKPTLHLFNLCFFLLPCILTLHNYYYLSGFFNNIFLYEISTVFPMTTLASDILPPWVESTWSGKCHHMSGSNRYFFNQLFFNAYLSRRLLYIWSVCLIFGSRISALIIFIIAPGKQLTIIRYRSTSHMAMREKPIALNLNYFLLLLSQKFILQGIFIISSFPSNNSILFYVHDKLRSTCQILNLV